jgi:hypothetical protein
MIQEESKLDDEEDIMAFESKDSMTGDNAQDF